MNSVEMTTVAQSTDQRAWQDWRWQQRNAIRTVDQLRDCFPGLLDEVCCRIEQHNQTRRMQLTPYFLTLIQRTADGSAPLDDDPLWRQTVPRWLNAKEPAQYDAETENWEMPDEMVTPIAQHKYDNRVIIRLANVCHAYCQFCYEALRTLEKQSSKLGFRDDYWSQTVEYVAENESVEEVILSGGEPLMHSDEKLDQVLSDLRLIGRDLTVRIHTRSLTFNPFRITDDLVEVFSRHGVNSIGLHVSHPHEISDDFRRATERLRRGTPILFANIPLLRGINDDVQTMHDLGMNLYATGVLPHYLYHFMPYSPGAVEYRTPVRTGVELLRQLKRRITNLAVPEFVLPHHSGKHTVPLLAPGDPGVVWTRNDHGQSIVRYTNWRDECVEYPDVDFE